MVMYSKMIEQPQVGQLRVASASMERLSGVSPDEYFAAYWHRQEARFGLSLSPVKLEREGKIWHSMTRVDAILAGYRA